MKVTDYGVDDYNEWAAHLAQYIQENAWTYGGHLLHEPNADKDWLYKTIRKFQEEISKF